MNSNQVRAKASLDAAAKEYETFKFRLASAARAATAPERAAAAREQIAAAQGARALDKAFANAVRLLRR